MSDDDAINALRQSLAGGPIDKRMLAKFDLLVQMRDAVLRKDMNAQLEIASKIKANEVGIQAEKNRLRSTMNAAFDEAKTTTDPDDRTTKLVKAFELTAKTKYEAYDSLGDKETGNAATVQAHGIAVALDAIPPGRRSALAVLLDNADVGVRVMAAVHLTSVMPERVIPILREINENEGASSVGFTAMWALPPNTGRQPPGGTGGKTKP